MDATNLTPQDQAINHFTPTFTVELYEHENVLRGHFIDWIPSWEAKRGYSYSYEFKGKEAIYIVCTHDASILRHDALEWCKLHHMGKLQTHRVDLSVCNMEERRK